MLHNIKSGGSYLEVLKKKILRMHFLLSSFGYIIYYFFFPLPPGAAGVHKEGPPHDASESENRHP